MKRGEVWWVNFNPSIGGEIKKKRPAIIISNDTSNQYVNRVQVVPMTRKLDGVYPCEALITFKGKQNKAMADQIATVSKKHLYQLAGKISNHDVQKIMEAVKIQFDMI